MTPQKKMQCVAKINKVCSLGYIFYAKKRNPTINPYDSFVIAMILIVFFNHSQSHKSQKSQLKQLSYNK